MITLVDNGVIAKYIGLSTDDKPQEISANIGMKNGSRFLEIDTGDKYYYDADSSQWMKQPSESGGGSVSGTITISDNGTFDVSSYAEAAVNVPTGEDLLAGSLVVTNNVNDRTYLINGIMWREDDHSFQNRGHIVDPYSEHGSTTIKIPTGAYTYLTLGSDDELEFVDISSGVTISKVTIGTTETYLIRVLGISTKARSFTIQSRSGS